MKGKNITKLVEQYISSNPSVKDCVLNSVINYSKLSRLIAKEYKLEDKKIDSIIVACRRYFDKYKKTKKDENKIKNIISQSSLTIKDKMAVIIIEKPNLSYLLSKLDEIKRFRGTLNIIQSTNAITIVFEEKFLEKFKTIFKNQLLRANKDLVQITIEAPIDIEEVPGHNAYIFSLLANKGINIVEQMSCWTDTLILIESKDTSLAIESLNQGKNGQI